MKKRDIQVGYYAMVALPGESKIKRGASKVLAEHP